MVTAERQNLDSLVTVTYADAVSFAVMRTTRCTHVLGFDADFEAAGFPSWAG
jgi:predicted nucleic acid-binding protein